MTPLPGGLEALRAGGKLALAAIETREDDPAVLALLDAACADPRALVAGFTGPPGVGKSTLVNALIARLRGNGRSVGVIAVDPSSLITGGALLGDRTRIRKDPAADTGAPARRALADVEGAIGLVGNEDDGWKVPVLAVSAETGEGLGDLIGAVTAHGDWLSETGSLGRRAGRLGARMDRRCRACTFRDARAGARWRP